MDGKSIGAATTANVKKRVSKWDVVEDPRFRTVVDNFNSVDVASLQDENVMNSGLKVSKCASDPVSKWTAVEGSHIIMSEDSVDQLHQQSRPEGEIEVKNISFDKNQWDGDHHNCNTKDASNNESWSKDSVVQMHQKSKPEGGVEDNHFNKNPWDGDKSAKGASNNDAWSKDSVGPLHQQSRPEGEIEVKDNRSEKNPWDGDHRYSAKDVSNNDAWGTRSRSRSPRSGWGSSWRSRSPHGFKHEEGIQERVRGGKSSLHDTCRDFAAGRCRRGGLCRFIHEHGRNFNETGHSDAGHFESKGNSQERGGFSRFGKAESRNVSEERSGNHLDRFHGYDEKPQRNDKSSTICNDFLKGMCSRGSACKYLHDGVNVDGRWSTKDARERPLKIREDITHGHDQKRGSSRVNDIPCKFYVEGRCRNGERCKFSHQGPMHSSSEVKSQDTWHHDDSTKGQRSWESSNLSEKESGLDVSYSENQPWNDPLLGVGNIVDRTLPSSNWDPPKWVDSMDVKYSSVSQSWDGSKCGEKDVDKNVSSSPGSKDNSNVRADEPGGRSEDGPLRCENRAEMNMVDSYHLKINNNGVKVGVSESSFPNQFCTAPELASLGAIRDGYPQNMDGKGIVHDNQYFCAQNADFECEKQRNLPSSMQPVQLDDPYIQHPAVKADSLNSVHEEHSEFPNGGVHIETGTSSDIFPVPGQTLVENTANQNNFPSDLSNSLSTRTNEQRLQLNFPPNLQNLNSSQQVQQTLPLLPHEQNFNPNMLNMHMFGSLNGGNRPIAAPLLGGKTDQNGMSLHVTMQSPSTVQMQRLPGADEAIKGSDLLKDDKPISGHPAPQNAASTERGTQLSNLSVSLAQIFGDGQQLPQLYATLNHLNATGMVPSQQYSQSSSTLPSVSVSFPVTHPAQGSLPQNRNMTQVNTNPAKPDISNQSSRLLVDANENSSSFHQLLAPQQMMSPSSVAAGDKEDAAAANSSMGKSKHENHDSRKDIEAMGVKDAATLQSLKDNNTLHPKDMHTDDLMDEGKKGMKMFKFALVEFVKDLLKPAWKEGHMSREAHKTIVKKVVDKVTSSIEGPQIPQTQEKIDLYLSHSKVKLRKLVDAYVEKYLKI